MANIGHADARMTQYYDVKSMERLRAVPERIMEKLMPANVVQMPVKLN